MKDGDSSCFDAVVFIGKKEYTPHLIQAVGNDFVLTRGAAVAEYIKSMKSCNSPEHEPQIDEQSVETV